MDNIARNQSDGRWRLGPGQPKLVSVVVTAYNQDWVIRETLGSVAAQTYRPLECILVNDGSGDDSGKIMDEFARDHGGNFHVQVIHQANQGAQGARNNGLRVTSGEFIQFLDGDDLLAPGKIKAQTEFLLSASGVRYNVVYGDSQWIHGLGDSAKRGEMLGVGPSKDILCSLLELDPFNPPFAYLSRRTVIEQVGPWDASLTINDDVDYFLQIACHSLSEGRSFYYLPVFTGYYRQHSRPRISEGGLNLRVKFNHLIFRHAETTMRDRGLLTPARRKALAQAYYRISSSAAGWNWTSWRSALADTIRVEPNFTVEKPRARVLQRIIGLWAVETLQAIRRQATGRIQRD